MRRYGKHTDEDDIRVRPSRKGTRPRTHIRPKHEDASEGMVLTVDRGRLTCPGRGPHDHRDEGPRAGPQGRGGRRPGRASSATCPAPRTPSPASCGSRSAPRCCAARRTTTTRTSGWSSPTPTSSPSSPPWPTREPRPRLIDRCLVAAYDAGLEPLLVLTKSDLAPADNAAGDVRAAGRAVRGDQPRGAGGRRRGGPGARAAATGGSPRSSATRGVGKTTLVNALVPERQRGDRASSTR